MHTFVQEDITKTYRTLTFFVFSAFLLFFLPSIASAATLSLTPANGTFETGDRVAVKVLVTSNNVPFNAVSGTVSFPISLFTIESVSKVNSALNFWVTEPTISNSTGTVKFEGIALGGSTSSSGTVLTINLRAVRAGSGQAAFTSGQILANDGEGTDITGNLAVAVYSVKEAIEKVTPATKEPEPIAEPVQEESQPKPSLKAPEIMLGTKYGAQSVIGTSQYPKAQVLMTFLDGDGTKIFIIGTSDIDGSFNVLVPNSLKRGEYNVSAVMIKADKTNSETSNNLYVEVGNIISDISFEVWILIALLVLTIIYLLIRVYAHFKKGGPLDKRKLKDAEDIVHKSFNVLREDMNEFDDAEDLDSKDHKHITGIKKDLTEAEKLIDKKIKDIQ